MYHPGTMFTCLEVPDVLCLLPCHSQISPLPLEGYLCLRSTLLNWPFFNTLTSSNSNSKWRSISWPRKPPSPPRDAFGRVVEEWRRGSGIPPERSLRFCHNQTDLKPVMQYRVSPVDLRRKSFSWRGSRRRSRIGNEVAHYNTDQQHKTHLQENRNLMKHTITRILLRSIPSLASFEDPFVSNGTRTA